MDESNAGRVTLPPLFAKKRRRGIDKSWKHVLSYRHLNWETYDVERKIANDAIVEV